MDTGFKSSRNFEKSTARFVGVAVVDTGINLNNAELSHDKKRFYIYDPLVPLQDSDGHRIHVQV